MLTKSAAKKYYVKLQKEQASSVKFELDSFLFLEQLSFVKDNSPNKIAVCSRRSGKTIACAADLIYTCILNQETVCVYITLSRNNAKKIIWRELKKINKNWKLGAVFNESELSVSFPNSSVIYVSGAKDVNEIEKFRGLAIKKVYIDEAQSFRAYIKELIDDVLSPALMDYAGTLCLIGTPGPIPSGYFYDCFRPESTWSKHAWSFWNNPFITQKSKLTHKEMLERELARRGVQMFDPSIQREWFGKWVLDSDSLVLCYQESINDYKEIPTGKNAYVMGIDLGFDDADAIAVLSWNEKSPITYLVEEVVVKKQGLTELVDQIQLLRKKYDIAKMVIDQGGLGKKLAEELRRRHQLPVEPAEKTRKMENLAFLNDALRTGKLRAKKNSKFAEDCGLVEIDKDKSTPDKIKISDRYHSDIIDAVLYAFKLSPAYAFQKAPAKIEYGSKEWAKATETKMFEAEMEGMMQERELLNEYGFRD